MSERIDSRVINYDIIKTIAMVFIIIWHYCVHGIEGRLWEGEIVVVQSSTSCNFLWYKFVEALCAMGVNLFVLTTGYFMINVNTIKLDKLIRIYIQMFFWIIVIQLGICAYFGTFFFPKGLLLPLTTNKYWFMTSYFELLLLSPFLNILINALSLRNHLVLVLTTFIIVFSPGLGYTHEPNDVLLFICLYVIASFIRRYKPCMNNKRILLMVFSLFFIVQILINIFCVFKDHNYYLDNNSITLILSVCLFSIIGGSDFKKKWIWSSIAKLSKYSLGIYLIHDNPYVRDLLWRSERIFKIDMSSSLFIPKMLLTCIAIFVVTLILDMLREQLFELLGINNSLNYFVKFNKKIEKND